MAVAKIHADSAETVVSMQCYTTQRDPEAFPDPER